MKKIFILSIGALFCLAGCSDDPVGSPKKSAAGLSVEKVQRAFVGYVGASWCAPCGSAGGPGFKLIREEYSTDEVVGMYFAPSGVTVAYVEGGSPAPYVNQYMSSVMKSDGTIPFFSINGINVGGAYVEPSYTLDKYSVNINEMLAKTPELGIAASQTLTDGKLTCNVAVEAYSDYSDPLYYSVMAVEKKAIGFQKVGGTDEADYEHSYIMRASLIGDGTMSGQELFQAVTSGGVSTGDRFDETFSLDFEKIESSKVIEWNYTPSNTVLVATLWAKDADGKYVYVNSVMAK